MSWWQIIKGPDNHLEVIEGMFNSNPDKAIGYIPIAWDKGQDTEIKQMASRLGLKYKKFPKQFESKNPDPRFHSYSNGGHFMWNESKIEPYLEELPFDSVDSFINYIAVNSYKHEESWRHIPNMLFGMPNPKYSEDRR